MMHDRLRPQTTGLNELESPEATYRLRTLEVYNWGPFAGLHRAEMDAQGTAVIGPTGSGKTTLIDGLMTLLVAQPRYNLASTGGHESDRTLISYVRGVLGGDGSTGGDEVARRGKTITGLCATYSNGNETLKLGGLLWIEGSSFSNQDLKRRWIFSQAEGQSLEDWLRLTYEEGVRELMRQGRETANLRIFDSKKAYLASTRRFFDVSENAFTLLNRAAGLKQLNSIDEIFRELVLDDRSKFDRALEVASEFDNLASIHAELETARKQQQSLLPVAEENDKLEKTLVKAEQLRELKQILPVWYAMAVQERWALELERIATAHAEHEAQLNTAAQQENLRLARVNALREQYLELGGNVIGELENTIAAQRERAVERRKHSDQYQRMARTLGLAAELTSDAFESNRLALAERREKIQVQRDDCSEATLTALSEQRELETQIREAETALEKVRQRPASNIPPRFQDFRTELASELDLKDEDLPFLAELVEVKADEAAWRGAIERAIGSDRLRILVPEEFIGPALNWVNGRDNRLNVRLQRARPDDKPREAFRDGFIGKLNLKSHALINTARALLHSRDRHCVGSPESLRNTEHGLTIEGSMSGRGGKFEKQDQRRLDQDWMTGFDNKDQLESLSKELAKLRAAVEQCRRRAGQRQEELKAVDQQLAMVDRLSELDFSTIDAAEAEAALAGSQQRLSALLDPKSDANKSKVAFDTEEAELHAIRQQMTELRQALAVLDEKRTQAASNHAKAGERIGDGLTESQTALATKTLPLRKDMRPELLDLAERRAAKEADAKLDRQVERVAEHEKRLVRLMEVAKGVDTGALVDTGSELEDVSAYLDRLRLLNEEALPEKLSRFLDYLNRSSDQGVTQLLSGIGEEVDEIEQRISDLNQTLVKVDFRSGRYLQLQPQRMKHECLRNLETAMRKMRSATLKDDRGESHYKALRELVDLLRDAGQNRRQQASRALLDPRYRLQFFVVEVDRQTGDRSPPRTGSQSGSGGEKELMASHILTASLSYALCPPEATRPLYGTVVLDEAFSKSSPSAATRIIEALRIFHLHPIFVTPNKEIGLLKQHTRKVICVQRPGKQASLASISWEKLEGLARPT